MNHTLLRAISLIAVLVLASCKKEEASTDDTGGSATGNGTAGTPPSFGDADGVRAAVRSHVVLSTPLGNQEVIVGIAAGGFSNDQFATRVSVGPVSCNGEDLFMQASGAYAYAPSVLNPNGIDLTATNEVTWVVGGGNGFASFTRTLAGPFPVTDAISSGNVVRAAGHTLTVGTVALADSVLFAVGAVTRTLAGSANSCTFTAAELGALSAGQALAQVVAYSSVQEEIGGKRIYFVKQSLRTKSVMVE